MAKEISHYSDAELYGLIVDGGRLAERAFEELYRRLAPRVFKYCRRVLGNQELAEDIFQETFVRFYRSASAHRGGSRGGRRNMTNVVAYILKIARNLSINAKSSKHYNLHRLEGIDIRDNVDQYENRELMEIVAAAVEYLSDDLREPFVLREYDGLSYADIADVLAISLPTVKIRIYRAKQAIRKTIAPYLADLEQYRS